MELVSKQSKEDLGQILVESGVITNEQLEGALARKNEGARTLEQILVEERLLTPQRLAFFTSLQMGIPFVNLKRQGVQPDAVVLIPESVARKFTIIPIEIIDDVLVLAMENPKNIEVIEAVATLTKKSVEPMIATSQDIHEMIDTSYRVGGEIEAQLSQIPTRYRKEGLKQSPVFAETVAQAPVVRAIDLLIKQGVRDRASDIHIEPQEDKLRVRYRIDGILIDVMTLPLSVHPPLISRVKIMAGLNIAERRRPQDGQISFNMEDRPIDIRVATSNTINGEMVVMRILDKTFAFLPLREIGFIPETLEKYMKIVQTPFGIVLISGPTGAGKTTTQYATVNLLDATARNILTIEDPVEYHFDNINQMQVNVSAGVTFATGLRACMRLDPDVILVGEIRDAETAQIATQAALTGHLVISSVHANDTIATIFRMIDLGVEPFLLTSALVGVVAQRMVRRVCAYCSQPAEVTDNERLAYQEELNERRTDFIVGIGCSFCSNTGYLGRTGIFEILTVGETIRRMIVSGTDSDTLRAQAKKEGMVSLWHDGMLKVKDGITTPYEIMRNVYSIG